MSVDLALWVFIIVGVFLAVVLYFARVMSSLELEAKEKGKRIEFAAVLVAGFSCLVAGWAAWSAHKALEQTSALEERVKALEKVYPQKQNGP